LLAKVGSKSRRRRKDEWQEGLFDEVRIGLEARNSGRKD